MGVRRAVGVVTLAALCSSVGVAGCSDDAAPADPAASEAFGGAHVAAFWDIEGGNATVRVVIEPDRDGFHLYSTSLVPADHRGLGIPTSLTVRGGSAAAGPTVVEEPEIVLNVLVLHEDLPVYPDGVVHLSLPVSRVSDAPTEIVLTFALCSAGSCLKPARDHVMRLPPAPTA
jgi:hypothetical protein